MRKWVSCFQKMPLQSKTKKLSFGTGSAVFTQPCIIFFTECWSWFGKNCVLYSTLADNLFLKIRMFAFPTINLAKEVILLCYPLPLTSLVLEQFSWSSTFFADFRHIINFDMTRKASFFLRLTWRPTSFSIQNVLFQGYSI